MGIRGKAYELIASSLSIRNQAVKINGHKSEYIEVTMGVLQGSILGPLIFLLYYNGIIDKMPKKLSYYLKLTVGSKLQLK